MFSDSENFGFGANRAVSKHHFSLYINDQLKATSKVKISVVVSGDTIRSKYDDGFYCFPAIDSSMRFDIVVKVSDITFSGQDYPGWMLNTGSRITFGRLTRLNKLTSVADYNGMTEKDEGWEWYSKRFFVINRTYTLDIDNRGKIKEMQFLVINPNSSGKSITTQKVVR
jgi:hypothetical protein